LDASGLPVLISLGEAANISMLHRENDSKIGINNQSEDRLHIPVPLFKGGKSSIRALQRPASLSAAPQYVRMQPSLRRDDPAGCRLLLTHSPEQ
jgi:hypothetical protein